MNLRRPALLTLRVTDLARSLAFWHERLKLPIKLRAARMAELQTDTVVVVLVEGEAAGGGAPSGGAALGWEVDDLDAARAELATLGIACRDVACPAGVDAVAFGRRIEIADPDGHRLEIVSWATTE